MNGPMSERARDWAIWLTRQSSVTRSEGEQNLPNLLAARVAATPAFQRAGVESWLMPIPGDKLARSCFALLVRGRGTETVLLTGHFDTVATDDYGGLADVATDPERLAPLLLQSLSCATTAAEIRARHDLEKGQFIPGRGLLDMKAGLAAALATAEAFAHREARTGNLLFVAVPDEEVSSWGARGLAAMLKHVQRQRSLEVHAAINLDAIADDADGTSGRIVGLGSVGKLLLTALVIGKSAHACYPFAGLNAGALTAAIAAEMEWAPALRDPSLDNSAPPTLLSLKDGKNHYDVTSPATAFASWNVLNYHRGEREVMTRFGEVVRGAVERFRSILRERRGAEGIEPVEVLEFADVMAGLGERRASFDGLAARVADAGLDLPEQCRQLAQWAWQQSGRQGPAVILGFGSVPYPRVRLSGSARAAKLASAVEQASDWAGEILNVSIKVVSFFPAISDMSFLGEANVSDLGFVAANTPAWEHGVGWRGEVGQVPIVNIGPWGRDYHTPLERVQAHYAFEVLPRFLQKVTELLL